MKLKVEPLVAMLVLMLLGFWLVWAPFKNEGLPPSRPDSRLVDINFAGARGVLEIAPDTTYRMLFRDGNATRIMTRRELGDIIPERILERADLQAGRLLFRILNITTWASLTWIVIGFGGQIAFFGRMAIQWLISERRRESVVPASFWYLSFVGGVLLFAYFAWRRDIIGVIGQTTGVVIYARNIRLIRKAKRREERLRAGPGAGPETKSATAASE